MDWCSSGSWLVCHTIIGCYEIIPLEKYYYAQLTKYDGGRIVCSNLTIEECKEKCLTSYRRTIECAYKKLLEI